MWRVSTDGKLERLPFEFRSPGSSSGWGPQGTTQPLASPDQRWIAFIKDNDLWLLKIATGQTAQVTHVGKPHDDNFLAVETWITAWSPDSRHVLYSVEQGIRMYAKSYKVHPADYGFHIYDLETKTSHPIKFPGTFKAWLPDGDFLLSSVGEPLLLFTPGEATARPVKSKAGWYGQFDVSADGRWVVATFGKFGSTNQILKISLSTGQATQITPVGVWTEYQWPRLSPSALRIAFSRYERRYRRSTKPRNVMLVVDGEAIYPCAGQLKSRWIDDRTITAVCQGEIVILDVETGEEKGRHKLE